MGKTILLVLLSGFLMLGLSSAFAEEPTLSDQEVLKAWGQVQTDVKEITTEAILAKKGLKPLTDENLDEINAAGRINLAVITNNYNTLAAIANTGNCLALAGFCSNIVKTVK